MQESGDFVLIWNKTQNKFYFYGKEITESEYNSILETIRNRPAAPDGYTYRLTESLEWELYELPEEDADPELTADEALDIILGGAE